MSLLSTITITVPAASLDLTRLKPAEADVSTASRNDEQTPPEFDGGEDDTDFSSLLAIIVPGSSVRPPSDPARWAVTHPSLMGAAQKQSDPTDALAGDHESTVPPDAATGHSSIQQNLAVPTATVTIPPPVVSTPSPQVLSRHSVSSHGISLHAVSTRFSLETGLNTGAVNPLPHADASRHTSNNADGAPTVVEPIHMPWEVSLPPEPSLDAARPEPGVAKQPAAVPTGVTSSTTELPAAAGEIDVVTTRSSEQHMEVSLRTPEMGQVWLEVKEVDHGIEARLEARAEITMRILQAALNEIRERVESIDVALDSLSLGFRQEDTHHEHSDWRDGGFPAFRHRREHPASSRLVRSPVRRRVSWQGQINVLA